MKYIYILIIPVFLVTAGSCSRNSRNGETVTFGDSIYLAGIPSQPDEDSWKFIEDLKSPMWTKHEWPENVLSRLASLYWKKEDVPKVVEAWQHFADGYENYPLTNLFQYYGPVHDGPVWPLLLKPADAPLSPSWLIASPSTLEPWPPSGDRIGECLGDVLTLDEVVELARRLSEQLSKTGNGIRYA